VLSSTYLFATDSLGISPFCSPPHTSSFVVVYPLMFSTVGATTPRFPLLAFYPLQFGILHLVVHTCIHVVVIVDSHVGLERQTDYSSFVQTLFFFQPLVSGLRRQPTFCTTYYLLIVSGFSRAHHLFSLDCIMHTSFSSLLVSFKIFVQSRCPFFFTVFGPSIDSADPKICTCTMNYTYLSIYLPTYLCICTHYSLSLSISFLHHGL
jgi:hypothetical protein